MILVSWILQWYSGVVTKYHYLAMERIKNETYFLKIDAVKTNLSPTNVLLVYRYLYVKNIYNYLPLMYGRWTEKQKWVTRYRGALYKRTLYVPREYYHLAYTNEKKMVIIDQLRREMKKQCSQSRIEIFP